MCKEGEKRSSVSIPGPSRGGGRGGGRLERVREIREGVRG